MNVAIPPEFESFARGQVEAGVFESEEAIVAVALRGWLADFHELKAMVDAGFAELDRGEGLDGNAALRDLISETRARHGG